MTPAGFPHSDIHGSKPACGSPWLFAAYHVFLRRPVPWHPPCALSNLIVTNLSSCQRIDFSIFDCFFLLRPTAKLFAFLRSCVLLNTFATGFFTRCFSIWLCSFQSTYQVSLFAIPENDTGSRRRTVIRPVIIDLLDFFASSAFSTFVLHKLACARLYRPGMNPPISLWILSLERR